MRGGGDTEYRNKIIQGDVLAILKELSTGLVDMCVTSPPYWGLRDYGGNGQLGLESTLEEYIEKMVEIFREVRRVVKDTATLWLNMGDCYNSIPCHNGKSFRRDRIEVIPSKRIPRGSGRWGGGNKRVSNLKSKDLCGMPWRLAFALQADGWYLRSDIIWHKPNPMPESVHGSGWYQHKIHVKINGKKEYVDCPGCPKCEKNGGNVLQMNGGRPTKSHEYLFLLTKKAQYFYDAEAIKEVPQRTSEVNWKDSDIKKYSEKCDKRMERQGSYKDWNKYKKTSAVNTRNKRTVWNIPTQPFPEAHFATFPEKLVEPCIKAGTSEKGYCAECGKPWVRVMEKTDPPRRDVNSEYPGKHTIATRKYKHDESGPVQNTIGWKPSCECESETVKPIVLDPFMGSGTTALVALKLNRDYLGIELKQEYIGMAENRLRKKMGLFV